LPLVSILFCLQLHQDWIDAAVAQTVLLLLLLQPTAQLLQCVCCGLRLDLTRVHAHTPVLEVGVQTRQQGGHW
jgi:hypothetical protein